MVIRTREPLPLGLMGDLREDFEDSELPFRMDVLDWAATSLEFQKIIAARRVVLKKAGCRVD